MRSALIILAFLVAAPATAQDFDCERTELSNGFRLVCATNDQDAAPAADAHIEMVDVQRYVTLIDGDVWLKFRVRALRDVSPFRLTARLSNSLDSTTCTEDIPALEAGNTSPEATIIPEYCPGGRSVLWETVRFLPPVGVTCTNCGNPPVSRFLPPLISDRQELDAIINDMILREAR